MKYQRLFAALSAGLLAISFAACDVEEAPPQETEVHLEESETQQEMRSIYDEEISPNWNGWAQLRYCVDSGCPNPGFRVETASGASMTVDQTTAQGNLNLAWADRSVETYTASAPFDWTYVIPASPSYIITPGETGTYRMRMSLAGYLSEAEEILDEGAYTQYFNLKGLGIREIQYREESFGFSGEEMEYELYMPGSVSDSWGVVGLFGREETQVSLCRDGRDLLLCSESAPCSVSVSCNRLEGGSRIDLSLGKCAAGQWYRIAYEGENTVLTEEPEAPHG